MFSVILFSCKKDGVDAKEMIPALWLSENTVDADGSTTITITAKVIPDSDPSRRTVVFKTSSGDFVGGKDGTFSKKAELDGDSLVAQAQIKAPSKAGTVFISVKIDLPNEVKEYWVRDSLIAINSPGDSIKLTASSFGVMINFGSDVTITGTIFNKTKKHTASSGILVRLTDYYDGGGVVNGRFGEKQLTSNGNSQISTNYSPGFVSVGEKIWIRATIMNSDNSSTSFKDSVFVNTIHD
jgi:hypothetical protein